MKRTTLALLLASTPVSAALARQQQTEQGASRPASGAAQQQRQQDQGQAEGSPVQIDPATGRPIAAPPAPAATESAEDAAARMFLSGGSLMQAQLALRQQAAGNAAPSGVDSRTSFFAVPEPLPTVLRPHDLVTVVVREESSAKTTAKSKLEKQASLDAALQDYVRLNVSDLDLESRDADARLRGSFSADFDGNGSVDRKDSFVARITAEVLDVKPNGTVVLQARKRIANDEEEQVFILTGTCRAADITADNSVLSTQLHDLNLEKRTKGAVSDATRRGFIPRLLGRLNPF